MKTENALIIKETSKELQLISKLYADSGYFPDVKSMAQAFVKIAAGREMGLPAMAAMTGIAIIKGKPVAGAHIIASKVIMSGYVYRVKELSNDNCVIEFFSKDGESLGKSSFDEEDAKKADLLNKDNWKKYPRNMYFARAMANGQKWYCPDATLGMVVYTPDELGGKVDPDGNPVIDKGGKAIMDAEFETVEAKPEPIPPKPENEKTGEKSPKITAPQRKKIMALCTTTYKIPKDGIKPFLRRMIGRDFESRNDITEQEASIAINMLETEPYAVKDILDELREEDINKMNEVPKNQGELKL